MTKAAKSKASIAQTLAAENILLGSSRHPALTDIAGEQVQLGTIVARAQQVSRVSVEEWNAMEPEHRENLIDMTITLMQAEAEKSASDKSTLVNLELAEGVYTFQQFADLAAALPGVNVVDGMARSFSVNGVPATYESDYCYILAGQSESDSFTRGQELHVGATGYVVAKDVDSVFGDGSGTPLAPIVEGVNQLRFDAGPLLDDALVSEEGYFGPFETIHTDHLGIFVAAATATNHSGHIYEVASAEIGTLLQIGFQNGPVKEVGVTGVQNEHLLAILIHRTKILNERFPCEQNETALRHMKLAINAFQSRTADRTSRGVEGTNVA